MDGEYVKFGRSVALSGDKLLVGEGHPTGPGRVTAATRDGEVWTTEAIAPAEHAYADEDYGLVVAADEQGRALIGAPPRSNGTGTIYAMQDTPPWTGGALITAGTEYVGTSIALQGDFAAVGDESILNMDAQKAGGVLLLQHDTVWVQAGDPVQPPMLAAGANFGCATAVIDSVLVVGAKGVELDRGSVFIVTLDENLEDWDELFPPELLADARFGTAVAMDGFRLFVGAPGHGEFGAVFMTEWGSGMWESLEVDLPVAGAGVGESLALSGGRLLVGAPNANGEGRVLLFEPDEAMSWQQRHVISAPTPQGFARFGASLASAGDRAIVGEPGRDGVGAVYEFSILRSVGEACNEDLQCASMICFNELCCEDACEQGTTGIDTGDTGAGGATAADGTTADSGEDGGTRGISSLTSGDNDAGGSSGTATMEPDEGGGVGFDPDDLLDGCNCSSRGSPTGWSLLGLFGLLRRRR